MKPYMVGLLKQRDDIIKKIRSFQDKCKHPTVERRHRANTGNYDPTCDCYWDECECQDCGKHWTEDK